MNTGAAAGICLVAAFFVPATTVAEPAADEPGSAAGSGLSGEKLYEFLSGRARAGGEDAALFGAIDAAGATIDWDAARDASFSGNIRLLEVAAGSGRPARGFYLVRELSGDVYVLALPAESGALAAGADSPYAGLRDNVGQKVSFEAQVASASVDGMEYRFVRLKSAPQRLLLDRLFFIAIVVLLFLTMVGMGLTLTVKDFGLVFKKPAGMIVGIV